MWGLCSQAGSPWVSAQHWVAPCSPTESRSCACQRQHGAQCDQGWCHRLVPSLHAPVQGITACIKDSAGAVPAHQNLPPAPSPELRAASGCTALAAATVAELPVSKHPTAQHPAQVTKVCVTTLVSNTYHAAIHLARAVGRGDPTVQEVQVDSRPSGERCPSGAAPSTPWGTWRPRAVSGLAGILTSQCSGRGHPAAT